MRKSSGHPFCLICCWANLCCSTVPSARSQAGRQLGTNSCSASYVEISYNNTIKEDVQFSKLEAGLPCRVSCVPIVLQRCLRNGLPKSLPCALLAPVGLF